MKIKITILLFINFISSQEINSSYNQSFDTSLSYGLFNEKIPFSFFDYAALINLNMKSEIYTSFSYLVFGGSVGIGYKYYFESKSKSSLFISTCAHYSILGDGLDHFYGLSISPGFSMKSIKSNNYFKRKVSARPLIQTKYANTSINMGLSFTYMGDHSYGIVPYISLENRF